MAAGLTRAAARRYAVAVRDAAAIDEDRPIRAALLQRLALAEENLGRRDRAAAHLVEACGLVDGDPDPEAVRVCAGVHDTLGLVARERSDLVAAQREHEHAIELYRRNGDDEGRARATVNLAVVLKDSSRISQARVVARRALNLARSCGERGVLGHCLVTLGLVHELLNNWMLAVRYQRLAATILSSCDNFIGAAVAVHNVGRLLADREQYDEAKMCFEQAYLLNQSAGSAVGQAADLGALAGVAHSTGDRDHARKLHEDALATLLAYGEVRAAVSTLADLSSLAQDDERLDEAARYLDQGEELAIGAGDLRSLYDLYVMRGDLLTQQGDIAAAEAEYLRAVDAAETPRAWLLDETEAIAYFDATRLRAHDRLVRLAVEHSPPSVAFEHSERTRSREMARRLAHLRLPPARHAPAELVTQEAAAFKNALHLLQELLGDNAADPATRHRYEQAERHWQELLDRIKHHDEQYVALRRGDRVTLAEIRAVLAEQHPRALLVEYYVMDHAVYVFGITADSEEPWLDVVPCDAEALRETVDQIARACAGLAANPSGLRALSAGLSDTVLVALVRPIVDHSHPGQHVCIVPHGMLHRIALQAIPVDGQPLVVRNPVVVAPSASVFRYCIVAGRADITDALVVTDPSVGQPLAFGREQARLIGRHFATDVLAGEAASRTAVLARLAEGQKSPGLLYFATHGLFVAERPMSSGIQLTDGLLTAQDLLSVSLSGSLVVVAACNTAVSGAQAGDEQLGLIRALLYAGASSVLVSLWPVDELATSMLLTEFCTILAGGGVSKAEGLRRAQLHLRDCTAAQAAQYARQARLRCGGRGPAAVPMLLAEARIRLAAGEYLASAALCETVLADEDVVGEPRERAATLHVTAQFAGGTGDRPDLKRKVYANPFFWAPFVLVGDWR